MVTFYGHIKFRAWRENLYNAAQRKKRSPPVNARQKGAAGEREAIGLLQPVVDSVYLARGLPPPVLRRRLEQWRSGGCDIEGLPAHSFEVKRRESASESDIRAWWAQAKRQAPPDADPVLIYRQNRTGWRVRFYGKLSVGEKVIRCPVTVGIDEFLVIFKEMLIASF